MTDSLIPHIATQTEPLRFPCAVNQRRYLAVDRADSARACLNSSFCYRLTGPLRPTVIDRAFRALIDRHEILRTRFVELPDGPRQEVLDDVTAKASVIDLTQLKPDQAQREVEKIGQLEVSKLFDLQAAPLLRLTVLQLSRDSSILLITAHATIIDGWSISIIVDELGRLIQAFDAGGTPDLPEVEMQFGDYACWQDSMITSGGYAPQLQYWSDVLAGCPRFSLPAALPPPAAPTQASLIRGVILPRDFTSQAEAFAQTQGTTFFHLGVAGLAAMLHRRSKATEVVIGTQVTGREVQTAEGIVGPLLNAVALRIGTPPLASLGSLLRETADKTVEALSNQSAPFECVVDAVAPAERDQRHPLYAINFALQSAFIHDNSTADKAYGRFEITSMPSQSASPIWDLNFALVERPIGWRMSCEANADMFDAAAVDRFLEEWRGCMSQLVSEPQTTISGEARGLAESAASSMVADEHHPLHAGERAHPAIEDDRILVLQDKGNGIPVLGLNVTSFYYNFAASDLSRRFYDIQLPDAEAPKRVVPRAMTDLAADAVKLVRQAQPHGPYVLMAGCIVGAVAIEVGRLLIAQGEEVPLVILNDTWAPGFREELSRWDKFKRQLQHRSYNLKRDLTSWRQSEISLREVVDRSGILNLLRGKVLAGDRSLRQLAVMTEGYDNGWYLTQIVWAYNHHRPDRYPGRVVQYRTAFIPEGPLFEREFGWSKIVEGGYEVVDIPCDHPDAMRDAGLAAIIRHLHPILREFDQKLQRPAVRRGGG